MKITKYFKLKHEKQKVGGVKIVYRLRTYELYAIWNLRLFLIKVYNPFFYKEEIKVYLRPLKKLWDTSRGRLSRDRWGGNTKPLTNMWLELEYDFGLLSRTSIPILREEISNHSSIYQHLKRATEEFFIIN